MTNKTNFDLWNRAARFSGLFNPTIQPQAIPETQTTQRQVSEYQQGGMPFGLGDGASLLYRLGIYSPSKGYETRSNSARKCPNNGGE